MNHILPIFQIEQQLKEALSCGSTVITAPTGSGKSTQVPKFLLDVVDGIILVLQPRRIAARMLAERVAEELGEKTGQTAGFRTRYENATSGNTRILFITEGILTRMMVADPTLKGVGAVVFDEFHERSLNTDLGLAMARHIQKTLRPDLKIAVMSATMDASAVREYLGNCPILNAEGRLYNVEISYCEQNTKMQGPATAAAKALAELLNSGKSGDVLIFMPGAFEIRTTVEACRNIHTQEKLMILPLYGDLPPEAQRQVMKPADCRKIIVATNIAETSLTIPGVRHVIDSGLAKISKYDPVRGVDTLETLPIARDSADQRAGRAGREDEGTCRRLWTWLEQSSKPARSVPEIQRVDLADAVLAVNAFGFSRPEDFPWFQAPPPRMLEAATALLKNLGCILPDSGGLTELGKELQQFPAHPRLAMLMHLGAEAGCFTLTAETAAIISERQMMLPGSTSRPAAKLRRGNARSKAKSDNLPASDFITLIDILQVLKEENFSPAVCTSYGVNPGAARDVARAAAHYAAMGKRFGWNKEHSDNQELALLTCILRAFPDRIAGRLDFGTLNCQLQGGRRAELGRESVCRDEQFFVAAEIREVAGSGIQASKLLLSLASGIKEDWLLDFFPDDFQEQDLVYWDERKQQVLRRQTMSCLGLCLEDKVRNDPDPDKAAAILADMLAAGKAPVPNWDEEVEKWIARVEWVANIFPAENLPPYDETARREILNALCCGETSLKALKNKDTLAFVKQILTYKQQQFVEEMAPRHILLPNGRRMKIEYIPGQTPKGRSRIQDFYDLQDTPKVAGGKVKILLDILAPNMRTVQITDDLSNFWAVLYPKIRTELARRYPRHLWR